MHKDIRAITALMLGSGLISAGCEHEYLVREQDLAQAEKAAELETLAQPERPGRNEIAATKIAVLPQSEEQKIAPKYLRYSELQLVPDGTRPLGYQRVSSRDRRPSYIGGGIMLGVGATTVLTGIGLITGLVIASRGDASARVSATVVGVPIVAVGAVIELTGALLFRQGKGPSHTVSSGDPKLLYIPGPAVGP
jgi:hypothetical protein